VTTDAIHWAARAIGIKVAARAIGIKVTVMLCYAGVVTGR
jgi:hypothetical protein